jgi:hypothetical protein
MFLRHIQKINKMKKYTNYLKENVDEQIKIFMLELRETLKDIKIGKQFIDFKEKFGISFFIDLKLSKLDKIPVYNSDVSIKEILDNKFQNFSIDIIIKDNNIDTNKVFSLISHEISHVYQLSDDKYDESFKKMIKIENFKNKVLKYKKDFLDYIYYNFLHELDARVNQTYEGYLYMKNKKSEENMWNYFMSESSLYKILMLIADFNVRDLIKNYDTNELLNLTNQFNVLYDIEEIETKQLSTYYENWKNIFKKNSDEYIEKSREAINQAYNDLNRYTEHISYCYDESILFERDELNIDDEIRKLVALFKKLPL